MNRDTLIRSLRKQLLIERIAMATLIAIFAVWSYCGHVASSKAFIVVDGKPIVCVPSENDAREVLSGIKKHSGCDPSEIEFQQDVVIARAPRDVRPVSRHRAMRAIEGIISPVVPKWAIIVDGKPAVAVPSRTAAGEVMDMAKLRFGKLVKNLAEEPQFKQKVTVDIVSVDPTIYRPTPQAAVDFLFAAPKARSEDALYAVKSGDLAGKIAADHGLKLEELWSMNPGANLHQLKIGQKIHVKQSVTATSKLTVVVRDQSERTESVPPPIQRVSSTNLYVGKSCLLSPGSPGKRRVKVATIYENGRKTGSEILAEETLREPTPRRIAQGIKTRR